mmetsp:Transcript_876/g.1973  ORF Transcript_876/g.1973 Transcript_876/m.1973 type:complete len:89 (+) Transcript_876:291-557(+)
MANPIPAKLTRAGMERADGANTATNSAFKLTMVLADDVDAVDEDADVEVADADADADVVEEAADADVDVVAVADAVALTQLLLKGRKL